MNFNIVNKVLMRGARRPVKIDSRVQEIHVSTRKRDGANSTDTNSELWRIEM